MVESHLCDEVTLESHVLAGFVRQRYGQDASKPQGLVDDSISEGQVLTVLHLHLPISDHPPDLFLHLVYSTGSQTFVHVNLKTVRAGKHRTTGSLTFGLLPFHLECKSLVHSSVWQMTLLSFHSLRDKYQPGFSHLP